MNLRKSTTILVLWWFTTGHVKVSSTYGCASLPHRSDVEVFLKMYYKRSLSLHSQIRIKLTGLDRWGTLHYNIIRIK